jgi:Luciferase-like monooxygenase
VRLALMIEGQEGVTWEHWVALASACEEHGVEALFRSDHYVSGFDDSRPALDAWATIAGLAVQTTKLELGTLVSPVTFRNPAVLARCAATADEISGGRITLGIGAGWMEREHEAYGFEFRTAGKRVARFADSGYFRADASTHFGENLAWGGAEAGSPRGALLGWLDSPKHRANLFKPDWTEQGIALVYVERFRGVASSRIWVSHFGHQG